MLPIRVVLSDLLNDGIDRHVQLATTLQVSPPTVKRWATGQSRPRPSLEARLREMHANRSQTIERAMPLSLPFPVSETSIREALDNTLGELREILHRRGRLSSRNEALLELCKLLFAHVMTLVNEGHGIARESVLSSSRRRLGAAVALRAFVDSAFASYLPESLAHEMDKTDFSLRIKAQEESLALEIIDCFERLAPKELVRERTGIGGVEMFNEVFGKFMAGSFIDERQLGQYLTPTEVVRFMVQLTISDMSDEELHHLCHPHNCKRFGLILDPACGVGSFLAETLRRLYSMVLERHGPERANAWTKTMIKDVVVGIDKSETMIRLALTNLAMFGFPAAKLHLANSLLRSGPDGDLTSSMSGRVGLILTNPPFGAEFEGTDLKGYRISNIAGREVPAKIDSEVLFLERYVDWLAPAGILIAIVPDSILTNKGIYEQLRNQLREQIDLRSVISLPSETFGAAGTTTKTSILHLRKRSKQRIDGRTFFAICHEIGYNVSTRGTHRTKVSNGGGELPKIAAQYVSPQKKLEIGCRVPQASKSARWDAGFHASLPPTLAERLERPGPSDVFVRDIAELSAERTDPTRWGEKASFEYIEISDVDPQTFRVHSKRVKCAEAPSRARKLVHAGDVLVSTVRPERRTIGVVQANQEGAVCTTGFAVLRPTRLDPLTLAHLLRTDFANAQIMRNNTGIAYPAIDEACLLDVLLPIRPDDLKRVKADTTELLMLEAKVRELGDAVGQRISTMVEAWLETSSSGDSRPR